MALGEPTSQTPIPALLLTVFSSILEVFILCLAGYILAGQGILDKKTQKQINHINVSLFTPALLFSKVAFFLSPAKLRELWVVPIFFVLVTTVSMAVAFSLGWLFGLKKSQRSFAMAAAMFMNSNSLPIALMQSLVVSVPGLKWGKGDNKNAMVGRALTYLVVYSTLGMVLRWSYGVRLLSQADDELEEEITITEERASLLIDLDSNDDRRNVHASTSHQGANHGNRPLHPRRRTTYYKSFPNSPTEEENLLGSSDSDSETFAPSSMFASRAPSSPASDNEGDDEPHTPLPIVAPPRSTAIPRHQRPKRKHSLVHRIRHLLRAFFRFMTVPLWAALAAVFVACTPPVQHTLESHLLSVKHALSSAGNCSIPLTLVVLGAYFHPGTKKGKDEGTGAMARKGSWASRSTETLVHSVKGLLGIKKPQSGPVHLEGNDRAPLLDRPLSEHEAAMAKQAGETKTVVIAVLSRMVITPLLIMPVVALSAKYDWHRVFEDPIFVIANVLLVSSPPALTLAQITQAASGDAFERLISRTIFWSYCILTPPATIFYVVLGLVLAKL